MLRYMYLIPLVAFLVAGCSLDEDVVAECERVHPNSLQGQLLCQSRVTKRNEAIAKEAKAKQCVDKDERRMRALVSSIQAEAKSQVGTSLLDFHKYLERKYPNQKFQYLASDNNPKQMIVVFFVKTTCDSDYKILINIDAKDEGNKVYRFRVWENSPPNDINDFKNFMNEFFWVEK